MIYLLCLILPPVAVLMKGKPIQALLNCILCFFVWIPGVIHAILVVNKANADKRHKEMLKAIKENGANATEEAMIQEMKDKKISLSNIKDRLDKKASTPVEIIDLKDMEQEDNINESNT